MEILRKTAAIRIAKQTEGMELEMVRDISLSGVPLMPELLAPLTGLTHLTLVFMKPKIKSFRELPLDKWPQLRTLELSDNAITVSDSSISSSRSAGDGLDTAAAPTQLPVSAQVKRLLLANNGISSLDEVRALAVAFPSLEVLDLLDNPLDTSSTDGVKAVFALFPKLCVLNARDSNGDEVVVEDSDESESSEAEYDDENDDDYEEDADKSSEEVESDSASSDTSGAHGGEADAPEEKRQRTE